MYKDKRSRTVDINPSRDNTHSAARTGDNTHSATRTGDNTRTGDYSHASSRSGDLREKLSKSRKSCESSRQDPQRVLKERSGGEELIEFTKFPRSSVRTEESSDERKVKQVRTLYTDIVFL